METQSIFMQMHNGIRAGEGSFNVALKELFYKADNANRYKLVAAFPEFFGDSVPEFGVYTKNNNTKRCTKCGKDIKGAHYNPPSGAQCVECWDEIPLEVKEEMAKQVLYGYGSFANNKLS